jgi:hypothetical protein
MEKVAIFVDGIASIGVHNGVVRIAFLGYCPMEKQK